MALTKEQRQAEIIINGQKADSTLKELSQAASILNTQLRNLKPGTEAFTNKAKELAEVRDRFAVINAEVKSFQKELNNSNRTLEALRKFALEAFAAEKVLEFASATDEAARKMIALRDEIAKTTGATGTQLDQIAIGVQAVSSAFGQEQGDVLASANALAKAYGIDIAQAVGVVEKSLLNVSATQKGEILEQIKEYSVQAKDAGLAIDGFAGVLVNSSNLGVFSDKGIDTVKEFGLRIREQTTATKDALNGAFGKQFTDNLLKGVNTGAISAEQALTQVSAKLRDTGLTAAQTQTVVADVFGGPGEDAGIDFLKNLDKVAIGLNQVDKNAAALNATERNRLNLERELATTQNELAKEYAIVAKSVDTASKQIQIFTFQGITLAIKSVRELIGFLYENRAALIPLTIALIAFNAQLLINATIARASGIATVATNAWRFATIALNLAMRTNPIGFVIGLIASLVTGVITAYNSFKGFRMLVDATWASFKAFIGAIAEGIVALANLDFSKAYKSFGEAGSRSAKAFNDSYKAEAEKEAAQRIAANKKTADDFAKAEAEERQKALAELEEFNKEKKQKDEASAKDAQDRFKQQAEETRKAREDAAQKELAAQRALEDLRNSLIKNSYEREIAELNTATNRKVQDVTKEGVLVNQQTQLIEEQRAAKIAEIREKQRLDEEAKAREANEKALQSSVEFLDTLYAQESEKNKLNAEAKQIQLEEDLLIEDENMLARYEALAVAEQERQAAEYESQRAFLESKLSLLQFFGLEETAEAQKIGNQLFALQNDQNKKKLDADKKLADGRKAIQSAELGVAKDFLDLGLEIAGDNIAAKVALNTINSVLTVADIIQKSNAEIAGYYAAYSLIPGGAGIAAGLSTAARIRAGIGIATVVAKTVKSFNFAKGGNLPEKLANGGMVYGPSHSEGGIKIPGTNIEIEGGEFVTNRLSSSRNADALATINARPDLSFMAVPRRQYETGGTIGTTQNNNLPANVDAPALPDSSAMMGMLMSKIDTLVEVINAKSDQFKEVNLSLLPLIDAIEKVKQQQAQNQS